MAYQRVQRKLKWAGGGFGHKKPRSVLFPEQQGIRPSDFEAATGEYNAGADSNEDMHSVLLDTTESDCSETSCTHGVAVDSNLGLPVNEVAKLGGLLDECESALLVLWVDVLALIEEARVVGNDNIMKNP